MKGSLQKAHTEITSVHSTLASFMHYTPDECGCIKVNYEVISRMCTRLYNASDEIFNYLDPLKEVLNMPINEHLNSLIETLGREELVRRIEEQRNAAQSETRSQSESMFKNKLAEIVLLLRGAQNAIFTRGPLNKATDNIERAIEIAKMLEQRETAK